MVKIVSFRTCSINSRSKSLIFVYIQINHKGGDEAEKKKIIYFQKATHPNVYYQNERKKKKLDVLCNVSTHTNNACVPQLPVHSAQRA